MENNTNFEIKKDVLYEDLYQGEKEYPPFSNGEDSYLYSSELEGKVFKDITVTFKKDGADARFKGFWHGHIFTEDEVSVLCSGGSVTFDSVEGDMVYTVTGSLKEVVTEVDPFNVSFTSSFKLYDIKDYEFVPEAFPKKYVPLLTEYDKKKLYVYHEGDLLEMEFICKELPDAAHLKRLLDGGIIEVVGKAFTETGAPAVYYGYELRKASTKYGGYVIHYNDGSFIPLKNSLGAYRLLYKRSRKDSGLNITLNDCFFPKNLDYKKIAERAYDMNYLYDMKDSETIDNELGGFIREITACPVNFSGVWNGHIFTPEEIGALSRGESVEFEYFDSTGELCRVKGGIEICGAHCDVYKEDGSIVVLDKYDMVKNSKNGLHLTEFEFYHEYFCDMEFVPDGGMTNYIPQAEEEEFESYDPDGNVPY